MTFLLKVDKKVWTDFKARIAREGRKAHWTIVRLIQRYAKGEINANADDTQTSEKDKD